MIVWAAVKLRTTVYTDMYNIFSFNFNTRSILLTSFRDPSHYACEGEAISYEDNYQYFLFNFLLETYYP